MSKATEENRKLKRAIVISAVLHVILFAVLIWSSFDEHIEVSAGGGGGSSIDAVMVDLGTIVQQYDRQKQQQESSRPAAERREKQEQQQAEELKALEKQRIDAQEQVRQQAEQKKQAEEATKRAQEQQKQAEAAAAKAAAVAESEKKAVAEKQAVAKKAAAEKQAAAEARKKAAVAKASKGVDDLLGDLSSGRNAPKTGGRAAGNNASPTGSGNTKSNGASGADISNYGGQIKSAIESKLYDAASYAGKTCTLRITLAPSGLLLDIKSEGGDPALCHAAISAARQARIPKPPSQAVYDIFKNVPLDFKL